MAIAPKLPDLRKRIWIPITDRDRYGNMPGALSLRAIKFAIYIYISKQTAERLCGRCKNPYLKWQTPPFARDSERPYSSICNAKSALFEQDLTIASSDKGDRLRRYLPPSPLETSALPSIPDPNTVNNTSLTTNNTAGITFVKNCLELSHNLKHT